MTSVPPDPPSPLRRQVWCALAVVALAVAVRAGRLDDGLWLDEMTTLDSFVRQPWRTVLAAGPGQYLPNNHVLHTILAKLIYPITPPGAYASPAEALLRLPALVAGCLLPVALAWPLRRRAPLAALVVGVIAAVHPWLVALGAEARGYTLMLLLGVVATHLLPSTRGKSGDRSTKPTSQQPPRVGSTGIEQRISEGLTHRLTHRLPNRETTARLAMRGAAYAVALAAAVYTVPLAVLLLPAHAVAVALTDRVALRRWLVWATVAMALAVGLYLPMRRGLAAYYAHPYPATMDYRGFLDALPRMTLAGQRLPARPDPALGPPGADVHDPPSAIVYWLLPVLAIAAGTAVGWRRFPGARPMLASLGTVALLGALLPALLPSAAEVRFDTWTAPWFCLSVGLLLAAIAGVRTAGGSAILGRSVGGACLAVLLALLGRWDLDLGPNQQVPQTLRWVDGHAPPGRPVVVAYIGAFEVFDCYAGEVPHHIVCPAFADDRFRIEAADVRRSTGRRPWVVVPFEGLLRERDATFWRDLSADYRVVARFPGRFGAVSVFAPREDGVAAAKRGGSR